MIRSTDNFFVMLYCDNCISQIPEACEGADEAGGVTGVKADGGFVQDVDDAGETATELGGQLDALRFAAGKCGGGAVEREVVQADVAEEVEAFFDFCGEFVEWGGGGFQGGDPVCGLGDAELAELHDAHGGGVRGVSGVGWRGDFDKLQFLFQAEVTAGFAAHAFAIRARALRGIEREVPGGEIAEEFSGPGIPIGGLEGEFAGLGFARRQQEDARFRTAEAQGEFDGISEAGFDAFTDDKAVDDNFDGRRGGVLRDCDFRDFFDFTIDTDADEALALEVAQESGRLGGFFRGDGGEDDEFGTCGAGGQVGDDFGRSHA